MSRQLFEPRKLVIEVHVDACMSDQSVIDRIRWLASQDEWFGNYTRKFEVQKGGLYRETQP